MNRTATLLALLGLFLFPLSGCPTAGDDDDSATDDDDATGDDDDATGDDDDATGDDDDATGDDDDATGDDDDSAGDDDDSAGDDDDSAGDDDDSAASEALAVSGIWDDTAGFHGVTEHAWLMWSSWGTSRFDISQTDSAAAWLTAQNAASNDYNPSLWSKFEWFETGGQLYYCQVAFDAADEAAALSSASADQGDVNGGCGGYAWSTLDTTAAAIELGGVHVDGWATDHTVTDADWTQASSLGTSIFAISQFDNAGRWAVAQNDAANDYNPNLWSRFDWTTDQGDLYFCQTAYDAADEAAALATAAADASNPASAGCGGFGWSLLTP